MNFLHQVEASVLVSNENILLCFADMYFKLPSSLARSKYQPRTQKWNLRIESEIPKEISSVTIVAPLKMTYIASEQMRMEFSMKYDKTVS